MTPSPALPSSLKVPGPRPVRHFRYYTHTTCNAAPKTTKKRPLRSASVSLGHLPVPRGLHRVADDGRGFWEVLVGSGDFVSRVSSKYLNGGL